MTVSLISVILPVHDQADHVGPVVDGYLAALKEIPDPHEILLIVNGSRDASLEVCRALATREPSVRVKHSVKGGWGLAVKLGLQEARGDLICYTNLARTTPEDLALILLYARIFPEAIIKANRKIRDSWRRRLGSLLYNLQCRALFDLSWWDINGTPKVFPRKFGPLLELARDDDLIDAEFSLICRRQGYPMLEVPIFSARRHGGRSTTNYGSALRMYWGAFRLWRSTRTT